jgi:hypothetical protein
MADTPLICKNYPATDWRAVPRSAWSCDQWKDYYKAQKKATGKQNANATFVRAWKGFGVSGTGCDRPSDFYNYFKKEGIDVSGGSLETLWNETKNTAESFGNILKYSMYAVIAVVLIIIIGLLWSVMKDPARVGAAIATRGLSEAGSKGK